MRLGEWDGKEKDREYKGRGVDEVDSSLWERRIWIMRGTRRKDILWLGIILECRYDVEKKYKKEKRSEGE